MGENVCAFQGLVATRVSVLHEVLCMPLLPMVGSKNFSFPIDCQSYPSSLESLQLCSKILIILVSDYGTSQERSVYVVSNTSTLSRQLPFTQG